MYCRHCGVRMQQGMVICPECGTRQRRRASSLRCARCHRPIAVDLSVCPHCGRDVKPDGPRWRIWLSGLALVILIGFWGIGRLPVQRVRGQISGTWSRLTALVQIPEMPQSTLSATQAGLPVAAPSSRTPTATMAAKSVQTAAITNTVALTATVAASAVVTATVTPDLSYTIRGGDTLSGIGATTGIPWALIARLNGLNQYSSLQVGQKLILPTATPASADTPAVATASPTSTAQSTASVAPTPTATATTTPSPTATARPTATIAGSGTSFTYRVQPGDTLLVIGTRFGIPWQTIAAANGLGAGSVLQVGQQLIIPGANATPVPANTPRPVPTRTPPRTPTAPAPTYPAPTYPAPVLTMPGNNNAYSGDRAQAVFMWQPVPGLQPDAQYQVEFRWTRGGVPDGTFTRVSANNTGTAVPGWIYLRADQPARQYTWWVHVVRVTTDGKGGERIIELSPPSEIRTFYWN
jgi:LysM repeat protein/RNA polymerase subunit RPABC4/transcription elongation factor Spt4